MYDSNESEDVMAEVDGILIASLKSQVGMLEAEVERLKEGGCRFDCRENIRFAIEWAFDKGADGATPDYDALWKAWKETIRSVKGGERKERECSQYER